MKNSNGEEGTATCPSELQPVKSVLSDQVIIEALVKYCASQPLYRKQAMIRRDSGVEIALSALNNGVPRDGQLLIPISAAMKREVLAGTYIQGRRNSGRAENTLEDLRIVLKELDSSGDFTVPSIAHLRSLVAERISSLEVLGTTEFRDYPGSSN